MAAATLATTASAVSTTLHHGASGNRAKHSFSIEHLLSKPDNRAGNVPANCYSGYGDPFSLSAGPPTLSPGMVYESVMNQESAFVGREQCTSGSGEIVYDDRSTLLPNRQGSCSPESSGNEDTMDNCSEVASESSNGVPNAGPPALSQHGGPAATGRPYSGLVSNGSPIHPFSTVSRTVTGTAANYLHKLSPGTQPPPRMPATLALRPLLGNGGEFLETGYYGPGPGPRFNQPQIIGSSSALLSVVDGGLAGGGNSSSGIADLERAFGNPSSMIESLSSTSSVGPATGATEVLARGHADYINNNDCTSKDDAIQEDETSSDIDCEELGDVIHQSETLGRTLILFFGVVGNADRFPCHHYASLQLVQRHHRAL
uniref:Uncharacterized protein n=1 Tax=Anopheles albimanus TaxID=7167 RepID=A0A182FEL3_ANOAL